MTHTPGPWHQHVSDINGVVSVRKKDGTVICQVWKPNDLTHARLIAAAPETAAERDRLKAINAKLLAALKGVASVYVTTAPSDVPKWVAAVEDAIAKAQGDL